MPSTSWIVDGEQIPEGTGRIRFRPVDFPVDWIAREEARPWTWFQQNERRFIARSRLSGRKRLVDGSLRLEAERFFHVEQIDLDGAALKIANTARTVVATSEVVTASPGATRSLRR
ncbi:MAG: hypothetical protein WKF83_17090 [Nocardioidaceae bacterium]